MTALQRILERMPDDAHRQSFLRIIAEAGVRDDSADMTFLALDHEARWAAVQAMSAERERIETLLAELPDALRAAGLEITRAIAGDISSAAAAAIKAETAADFKRVAAGAASDLSVVINAYETKLRAAISPLVSNAHDLRLAHDRLAVFFRKSVVAHWLTYGLIAAIAASGAFAGTSAYDHGHLFKQGWNAGAAAVRASLSGGKLR